MPPSSSRRRAAAAFTASLVDLHLPGPDRPPKVRRLQRGVRRQAVRRWGKVTHSLAKGRTIGHTLESERPRNKSSASHTPAAAMMPLGPIKTPMSDTSCPRNPDLSQWPSCSAQCRTKCVGGWGGGGSSHLSRAQPHCSPPAGASATILRPRLQSGLEKHPTGGGAAAAAGGLGCLAARPAPTCLAWSLL